MNGRLDDFIKNNREEFDLLPPPERVWEKIEFNKQQKHRLTIHPWLVIAAAACMLLLVAIPIITNRNQSQSTNLELTTEMSEYNETAMFYETQIQFKQKEIMQLTSTNHSLIREMNHDLVGLDSIMIALKTDLKDQIDNREVVDAMIQNYRLKLSILEEILSYLDEQKKVSKTETHEI